MLLTIARIPLSYLEMNFFLQVATMQVWLIWSKGDSVYVLVDFLPPKSYVKTNTVTHNDRFASSLVILLTNS